MIRRGLAGAALASLLAGCAASPPLADGLPASAPRSIELEATPFFPQEDYQCGPAALATLLVASGVEVTPDALAPEVFIPGAAKAASRSSWSAPRAAMAGCPTCSRRPPTKWWTSSRRAGPCCVLQNLGVPQIPIWHYAVLIGYDADRNVAILRSGDESASR